MPLQLQLNGQFTAAPASSDSPFPSASTIANFTLNPAIKAYNVDTGAQVYNINAPSAFQTLPGVGPAPGPVTQASLVYMRTQAPIQVRLTYQGDTNPYVSYINGVFIVEPDNTHFITLVEVKGAGIVEFYACGLQ